MNRLSFVKYLIAYTTSNPKLPHFADVAGNTFTLKSNERRLDREDDGANSVPSYVIVKVKVK
jgi:hypothetical protein